jgi:Ran GTPase-activating protein 1
MPQNGIRELAIAEIAKAVEVNRNLRVLNLNDNIVKPNGALLIANALQGVENLEVLNLGDCLLKSAGAIHVLQVFWENGSSLKRLRELILNGNEIGGSEVVSMIQEMFEHDDFYNLKLDLSCNNFGEDRVEQLLEILENKISDLNIE